ncbi:hypothetical protein [Leisingera sp. S232]|uniref:hypothetical protein n=1 Tax=Leisingera sp. S232 TaxID=3415132 RepID=UPI003C7CE799
MISFLHPLVAGFTLTAHFGSGTHSLTELSKLETYGVAVAIVMLGQGVIELSKLLFKRNSDQ